MPKKKETTDEVPLAPVEGSESSIETPPEQPVPEILDVPVKSDLEISKGRLDEIETDIIKKIKELPKEGELPDAEQARLGAVQLFNQALLLAKDLRQEGVAWEESYTNAQQEMKKVNAAKDFVVAMSDRVNGECTAFEKAKGLTSDEFSKVLRLAALPSEQLDRMIELIKAEAAKAEETAKADTKLQP